VASEARQFNIQQAMTVLRSILTRNRDGVMGYDLIGIIQQYFSCTEELARDYLRMALNELKATQGSDGWILPDLKPPVVTEKEVTAFNEVLSNLRKSFIHYNIPVFALKQKFFKAICRRDTLLFDAVCDQELHKLGFQNVGGYLWYLEAGQ
jgi:hypothetical protein